MKKPTALMITIMLFAVFTISINSAFVNADWPMYRADPAHSGVGTSGTGNKVLAPTPLWNFTPSPNDIHASNANYISVFDFPDPTVANGVIYLGGAGMYWLPEVKYPSGWREIFAFNASSGEKIWNQQVPNIFDSYLPLEKGVLYLGTIDNFYALDATNGVKLWNYSTAETGSTAYTLADGVVYWGSFYGSFYALNATNGDKLWDYPIGISSAPAVANGVVYITSNDYSVYALNVANGEKVWSYGSPDDTIIISYPVVVNGRVYISTVAAKGEKRPGTFYALNATTGRKLWDYTGYSSPAVANGIVYAGFSGDGFYAMNATNGEKLWNFTTADNQYSTATIVGNAVYFHSGDSLYALRADNGEKIWNYTNGGGSSPVIADDILYYNSDDYFYALAIPYEPLPTPTPTSSPPSTGQEFANQLLIISVIIAIIVVLFAVIIVKKKHAWKMQYSST